MSVGDTTAARVATRTAPVRDVLAIVPDVPDLTHNEKVYASIVTFVAWTFAVYDMMIFGTLLPLIRDTFHWSAAHASYIATFVTAGSVVIGFAIGPVIDYLGRRKALMITTGGAALSSGLAALAWGPISLIFARSLSGFGQSEQAVNSAYLNEIFGPRNKGVLYSLVQAGFPIGVLLAAGTAALFTDSIGWRGTFAVATFPLAAMFVMRLRLRESPYFKRMEHVRELRREGRVEDAQMLADHWGINLEKDRKVTYAQLFAPDLRKHTFWLGLGFFMHFFASQQLTVLATTILRDGKGIDLTNTLYTLLTANVVAFFAFLLFGWLGDKFGRREMVIGCYFVAGLGYAFLVEVAHGYWPVTIAYTLALAFDIGAAAPLFAYVGESFPTRVRGTGAAFIATIGPVGGIVGGLVYSLLQTAGLDPAQAAITGAGSSVIAGLCFLGARRIPPGQPLEAIAQ